LKEHFLSLPLECTIDKNDFGQQRGFLAANLIQSLALAFAERVLLEYERLVVNKAQNIYNNFVVTFAFLEVLVSGVVSQFFLHKAWPVAGSFA
jgi:hypothetical protein